MRWQGRARSRNVIDRRGRGLGLPVGGGIGGLILLLLFATFTGQNPADLISVSESPGSAVGTGGADPSDPQVEFVSVILHDTEVTWSDIFGRRGSEYREPRLVLFSDATPSACGLGQSAMGPFYCPADEQVYLDLSFFRDLASRFGAPGDFAQAYVIAHEVGHHIQTITGLTERVHATRSGVGTQESNALSVQQELQADCLAGVWGYHAARRGMLEPGDADEGLAAAAAIGDDRLQRQGQGRVVPESFTHGSSAQRVAWLRRGLESGDLEACDTFTE